MAQIDISKKLAQASCEDWDILSNSQKAARAILFDCLDRRGIKGQFYYLHEDILAETLDTWAEIIKGFEH